MAVLYKTERPDLHPFTVVCAWCKALMRDGRADCEPSHGICPPCAEKWREEADVTQAIDRQARVLLAITKPVEDLDPDHG